jgi:hypothetical protein
MLLLSATLFLLGCVTVTEVPEKAGPSKREPSPPVTFRVDPRYAEWYTNTAEIENSKLRAQAKGDFLAASALYFKTRYALHFHDDFELRSSPTGRYSKLIQDTQSRIEADKQRREVQVRLKNDEEVTAVDKKIKSNERYIKELTKEMSPQSLAYDFVMLQNFDNRLGGIMFLLAYTHVANKGQPLTGKEKYLKSLRDYRVNLANTLADPKIPADVKKKGFELGDTLIKIEELFLSAKHEEAQMLAHKVATDILNQE